MNSKPSCGATPILNADESSVLTDKGELLERLAEHLNKALNCPSTVSNTERDEVAQLQLAIQYQLSTPPSQSDLLNATSRMSIGKAAFKSDVHG